MKAIILMISRLFCEKKWHICAKNVGPKNMQTTLFKKVVFVGALAAICILKIYRCPFQFIWGINCPGCGMTRAWISVLRLDFKAAFQYHPLFLPFGIETIYVVFYDQISALPFHSKRIEFVIGVLSFLSLLIVWYIRQFIIE